MGKVIAIAEGYYVDLFKAQNHTNMEKVLDAVDKVVIDEMVQSLT